MYIYDNVVILSSMWYVLRFKHAYGLKRYKKDDSWSNVKRPVVLEVPLVLASFYLISFLQFLLPFSEIDCAFDGLLTLLKKKPVKAVAIFLFLVIKSTLVTVPCNENVPRLLLQQLRCYLSPLDVW